MRIVLATCGSRGDVQPMIALTKALEKAGHDPVLLGPPERLEWAGSHGCPYIPFGQNVTAFIDNMNHPLAVGSIKGFFFFIRQAVKDQLRLLPDYLEGADRFVASSLVFGGSTIAEEMKIPYRYIAFSPQVIPSADHPFPVVRTQTFPRQWNGISWRLARFLDRPNITGLLNRFRRKHHLHPINDGWDNVLGLHPILACDPEIAGIPEDCKRKVDQTGYLHLSDSDAGAPNIDRFVGRQSRIVFAGFGSMPAKDQQRHFKMLIRSARKHGCAIIISAPWLSGDVEQPSRDVLMIRQVPHRDLFPKMAAVIHHGGAGTTATALLSGVPQVIVPHILDQYYHAHKIFCSQLGPEPIWRSCLDVKKLTAALGRALGDPIIRSSAKKTAMSVDPERSLENAVLSVEKKIPGN